MGDKPDTIVNASNDFLASGSTQDTIAWLRKHFWSRVSSATLIIVGDTGENLTVFEYLDKYDPNYPTDYDIKPVDELSEE